MGLGLGFVLAKGLTALFDSAGLEMPQGDTVFATRTVVVSLLVGTVVTLLAGIVPAVRATRVPPIAAVRDGAAPQGRRASRRTAAVAVAVIAGAGALLALGVLGDGATSERLLALGGGSLLLFTGVAMISSRLVRPIAALVGWPVARLGASGRLARQNAVRNPARTAATAAALMVGLALVTFVSVLGTGLLDTHREGRGAPGRRGLRRDLHQRLGPAPAGRRAGAGRLAGGGARSAASARTRRSSRARSRTSGGVDPATIGSVYRFDWSPGLGRGARHAGRRRRDRRAVVRRWTTTWRSARRSPS